MLPPFYFYFLFENMFFTLGADRSKVKGQRRTKIWYKLPKISSLQIIKTQSNIYIDQKKIPHHMMQYDK